MNLALKDIRHGLFRFVLTCFGLGLLMTVVLAMIGIYNGLVVDALAVVKAPRADIWVVEAGTKGPFAEASNIPADTRDAVARMPGVSEAGAITYQTVEASHRRPHAEALCDRLRARPPRRAAKDCRRTRHRGEPLRTPRRPQDGPHARRHDQAGAGPIQGGRAGRGCAELRRRSRGVRDAGRCAGAADGTRPGRRPRADGARRQTP